MTQPDQGYDIPVSLDTDGVVSGANQGIDAVTALQAALAGLTIGAVAAGNGLGRVSSSVGRNLFGSASITAAADLQKELSGLAATSAVTGQSLKGFRTEVEGLSRSLPGGTSQAIATTMAVQQLGLAAKNQQPQIAALSGEFTRLGAAVGESAPQIATSFGQLNRELANLDPSRVSRFADVLTTLHATSGASASAIIGFSQAIGPVAQAAGLGESSILGISTAFTKLGDDGGAAATAVNKILTDLNESTREGTNTMVAYANATGLTVAQFRKLFEANPAQALTKVTGALANAGPGAPYLLQTLGLDPTRTQRALLELSQSGGLQAQIQTAVGAYGNGNTSKGAAAAFNNVDDKMQQLGTTAAQLGTALGTPVLRPLGFFISKLEDLAKPLAAIAGSGPGQGAMAALAVGLGGAKVASLGFRSAKGLSTLAFGYEGLTSGPVGAALGGARLARYGAEGALYPEGSWRGRKFNNLITAGINGDQLGRGSIAGFNRKVFDFSQGAAGSYGARGATDAERAAQILEENGGGGTRSVLRTALGTGGLGLGGYMRLSSAPFRLATQNAMDREFPMLQEGGVTSNLMQALKGSGGNRQAIGVALDDFAKEAGNASKGLKGLTQSALSYAGAIGGFGLQAGAGTAKVGGRLAGRGLSALGGALFSPIGVVAGLAAGGIGAYEGFKSASNYNAANAASYQNQDVYGTLNKYLDALGEAGVATQTMAQQIAQASATIAATVTTHAGATTFTNADAEAFGQPNKSKTLNRMTGTGSQVAAQIKALNLAGASPSVLQGVKQDLFNQGYNPQQIDQIMAQVPATGTGQLTPSIITNLVAHIAHGSTQNQSAGSAWHSWNAFKNQDPFFGSGGTSPAAEWMNLGHTGGGHPNLTSSATQTLHELVAGVGQGYDANILAGHGTKFSQQTALSQASQIMNAALKTGNANTAVAAEQALTAALTGLKHGITGVTAEDIQQAGSLGALIQQHGAKVYGHTVASLGGPMIPGHMTPQNLTALQGQARQVFGRFYGGGASGVAGQVTQAATDQVGNAGFLSKTAIAVVAALTASGTTLNAIAQASAKSLNTTSAGQQAVQQAVLAQAQYEQGTQQIGMTQGSLFSAQTNQAAALMSANGPNSQAQYQQGQQLAQSTLQNLTGYYQQRLQAQFNYQIEAGRATQDFNLQQARSEQDFQIQSLRNQEDYNLQLKRNIQDAESSDYDPYTRIAAQPVFSAGELAGNLQLQNQALTSQVANLNKARADGLSAAAVNVLGLGQTANAQQLQQLVSNFASDPNVIKTINAEIAKRGGATGALYKNPADVTYARQKQDYDIQTARLTADFKLQQSRAEQDQSIQMSRMAQDLHDQDLQITGNMTTLQKDMIKILHGQTVDWSAALVNTMSQTIDKMKPKIGELEKLTNGISLGGGSSGGVGGGGGSTVNIKGSLNAGGGSVGNAPITQSTHIRGPGGAMVTKTGYAAPGTGSTISSGQAEFMGEEPDSSYQKAHPVNVAFNRGIAKSMLSRFGWKDPKRQMAALDWVWGEHESGWNQYATNRDPSDPGAYGIPQALPGDKMAVDGGDWRTNPATQILWGLQYIKSRYGSPVNLLPKDMGGKGYYEVGKGYAAGGIAFGPQLMQIAEGQSPEMALPLNQVGMNFLLTTMKQYIGGSEAQTITSGGQAMAVTINRQSYHYDSRQVFAGANMNFELTDPTKLGQQLDKRRRRDNLTSTKGGPAR